MALLPKLQEMSASRQTVDLFMGYNHNLRIRDNEFYDMKNMTGDYYPLLSPRGKRRAFDIEGDGYAISIASNDHLCWETIQVMGYPPKESVSISWINNDGNISSYSTSKLNPREEDYLVTFGSYIIVMPRGFYINTDDTDDCGYIENKWSSDGVNVKYTICDIDGNDMTITKAGSTAPKNPADGDYWLDTSGGKSTLKVWVSSTSMWSGVASTYVKINSAGIGVGFKQYDGVKISGVMSKTLRNALGLKSSSDSTSVVIQAIPDDDNIVIIGIIGASSYSQTSNLTVDRAMPRMDYVVEYGNRLWGCCFRKSDNSNKYINEIYACKLGDFKNWNCFMGLSTDSYVASVGSDGPFTGATSFNGYPIFFKEDCLHKVYGNFPSNYQVQVQQCEGVQNGCGGSIATINGTMYYKGISGVMAYDGSFPRKISDVFGADVYDKAHAGVIANKYYISMRNIVNGEYTMFCYDYNIGMWHKLDSTVAISFTYCDGVLWYLNMRDVFGGGFWDWFEKMCVKNNVTEDEALRHIGMAGRTDFRNWHLSPISISVLESYFGEKYNPESPLTAQYKITGITNVLNGYETEDEVIDWMVESGVIGLDIPDNKYVSRMLIKASMEIGSTMEGFIQYDSMDKWERVFSIKGKSLRTFNIPIRPRRCDHFRLRIKGVGDAKIYSITKTIEQGSDV